jgi:hypothetical protein
MRRKSYSQQRLEAGVFVLRLFAWAVCLVGLVGLIQKL